MISEYKLIYIGIAIEGIMRMSAECYENVKLSMECNVNVNGVLHGNGS